MPHRRWIIDHLKDVTSLYEIGCGAGANLRLIQSHRPEIRLGGSDGVLAYVEWAAKHCGLTLWYEPLPAITAPDGPWDAILVSYVLSYLTPEEAQATLHAVAQHARRGKSVV